MGVFASGDFVRGDRRLELHFRHSVGLVKYHMGSHSASHEAYMREVLGGHAGNRYPGFSDDPLDGFHHLAHDLGNFASDFLIGDGAALVRAALKEVAEGDRQQASDMARFVGDTKKLEEARRLFREGNFRKVVELLGSLRYSESMTEAEKKYLEISQRRCS